jgi:hypothetical protein
MPGCKQCKHLQLTATEEFKVCGNILGEVRRRKFLAAGSIEIRSDVESTADAFEATGR